VNKEQYGKIYTAYIAYIFPFSSRKITTVIINTAMRRKTNQDEQLFWRKRKNLQLNLLLNYAFSSVKNIPNKSRNRGESKLKRRKSEAIECYS
jgi:hypothetical protein